MAKLFEVRINHFSDSDERIYYIAANTLRKALDRADKIVKKGYSDRVKSVVEYISDRVEVG